MWASETYLTGNEIDRFLLKEIIFKLAYFKQMSAFAKNAFIEQRYSLYSSDKFPWSYFRTFD